MDYLEKMASACVDELQKIGQQKLAAVDKKTALKTLGLLGAGATGYHFLRKAKQDYQTGRTMRIQQGY